MKIACNAGNEQCLMDTYVQVHLYADHDRRIPRGLEDVIFCSGLKGQTKQGEWTEMWKKMQNSSDTEYRMDVIEALGCSDDPIVLKDYLESTLGSGNSVNYRSSERIAVLRSLDKSSIGLQAALNFIRDFESDIIDFFGFYDLEELLEIPARFVRTREQQVDFINFLTTLDSLEAESFRRLVTRTTRNLRALDDPTNVHILEVIHKIVVNLPGPVEDTTTVTQTTTTSTSAPTTTLGSTAPPTTEGSTSTTLGAATLEIKILTVLAALCVAFIAKF
jgi:ERAP1-like C-terminal domain